MSRFLHVPYWNQRYSAWGNPKQTQWVTRFVLAVQEHLQGRKSVERPFVLRIAEVLVCLFGTGFAGLGYFNCGRQVVLNHSDRSDR